MRELVGAAVEARVVPGVNPVDHAEQAHDGGAGIEIEMVLALQIIDKPEADSIVLALDGGDLGAEAILQRFVFVGEDLEAALIGDEIFEMILDEDANALARDR